MNSKIAAALNEQVIFEFNASYLYLAMSIAMADAKMNGYAAWLQAQYQEELDHAHKFITYLQDCDQTITLGDIKGEACQLDNPLEVAKAVLAHEQMITSKIHALYGLAQEEKDYATVEFLSWFVKEQVEEEASARGIIDQFTFAGDSKSSQLFVDAKLGQRQ
ncbi:ferritin [Veillonella sp. YH-vei2232]|jgi:ferritin|uniref:Ferritin n=1 Tax=Veillonella absiana TaxID=3079305 RepID=A0ABU3Z855_9FIRM|nr:MULTISPECIES: ferritin [unclassified Veillonella]NCB95178.1 ferritin [Negativicutes bacterium]MBP6922787.1 ferritin [Veillonella sp.]MBP8616840.1 ferritin [Veillonella sp.]MBP9516695.1 ferritin [Veillonella sp.]MBP9550519.1 ferritin [Veillonella sp.]